MIYIKELFRLLSSVLCLALLSACGGAATPASDVLDGPTPASVLLGPTPQMPADAAAIGSGAHPSPQPLASVGDLRRDAIKGLDSLSSYRLTYTLVAEPRSGGALSRLETFREVVQNGKDRGERVTQEGAPLDPATTQGPGAFETLLISGTAYLWTAEPGGASPTCASFNGGTFPARVLSDPSQSIIATIAEAKLVQRGDTVSGIAADHYAITTANGLIGSTNRATGELWIAQETGVVVKFSAQERGALGIASVPNGTLTANYTLEQVNMLPSVTLPPECVNKQPQS